MTQMTEQMMIPGLEAATQGSAGRGRWPMVKLGDISSSIDYGVTASANFDGDGNKFLRITDIQENCVDWLTVPWCICSDKELNSSRLKPGDIVFARTGATTGKSFLIQDCPEDTVFASYLIRVRLEKTVFPDFVSFFFQSPNYWQQVKNSARGAAQPGINSTVLKSLEIPLPPRPEQQRIVARLDQAQQLIDQRKEQLALMDALVQSLFYEMFGDPVKNEKGWEVKPLGEVLTIVRGGSPRPIEKYLGGEFPWIKIGDATQGDDIYLHSTKENIIKEGLSKTRLLPAGSVIFANCGVSLGFARIITFEGCIHDGWLALSDINPNQLEKIFLLKTLNSITGYFRNIAPDGTQPNLNTAIMKNHLMILPPLALQQTFADRVQQIEALKQAMTASLRELEHNFNALMQEAFGG